MKKLRFDLTKDSQWKDFLDRLLTWRDKQVRLTVTVQKYAKKRSLPANRYYWSVVVNPLAEATGYTPAEMHDEILGAYSGWETRNINGHVREFPRRRSTQPETMETMDFMGLIETGQRIAAELGVMLPDQEKVA